MLLFSCKRPLVSLTHRHSSCARATQRTLTLYKISWYQRVTPYTKARRFWGHYERSHVQEFQYGGALLPEYIECECPGLRFPYTQTQWQAAVCKRDLIRRFQQNFQYGAAILTRVKVIPLRAHRCRCPHYAYYVLHTASHNDQSTLACCRVTENPYTRRIRQYFNRPMTKVYGWMFQTS